MGRYCFWRAPQGKPHREDGDRFAATQILGEIGRTATVQGGGISWPGFGKKHFETALKSSVAIVGPDKNELNSEDTWRIVSQALIEVIKKDGGNKAISPRDFMRSADALAGRFFQNALVNYVVVSALSVEQLPAQRLTLNGTRIVELRDRRRFALPKVIENYPEFASELERSKSKLVKIPTSGRTVHEAMQRAMSDLDLLRSLWTLLGNYGAWSIGFGYTQKRRAIGVIHSGPVHTLHQADGTPVDALIWREDNAVAASKLFSPAIGWPKLENHRRWAQGRLRALPYRADLEDLLRRYVAALDQTNLDVAFLELWSILEKATGTIGANYDETIHRTVWDSRHRKLAAEMLGALRLHRNRLVHSAKSHDDRDQVAYLIKSFVEPHLLRLLRNDFKVASLEEYGQQLSLPTEINTLRAQQRRIGRSIRMIERMNFRP